MLARSLLLLTIAAAVSPCIAQPGVPAGMQGTELARWDFTQDARGWFAGHNVAPLTSESGHLVVNCTGPDPWIEGPRGEPSFEGSDSQFIAIRAKVAKPGYAEFFWELEEKSFVAGQEIGFQMTAGDWRTYIVFPAWKGRIARLRFDPADVKAQRVLIDWIAVVSLPPSETPREPVWDFSRGLQGWIPQSNVSEFSVERGALKLVGVEAHGPELLSPRLSIPADQAKFVSLRLQGRIKLRRVMVYFATEEKPDFDARRFVIVPLTDRFGKDESAIPTHSVSGWTGRITRLRLHFEGSGSTPAAWLKSAGLSPQPVGPAALAVRLKSAPAVLLEGETRRVSVDVQNVGGVVLRKPVARVDYAGRLLQRQLGPLDPGQSLDLTFDIAGNRAREEMLFIGAWEGNVGHDALSQTHVSRPPDPQPPAQTSPKALQLHENVWLVNSKVAACIVRNPYGYGPVFLFRRAAGGWRQVGVLAPGAVQAAPTSPVTVFPSRATTSTRAGAAIVTVLGSAGSGKRGIAGTITTTFSLASGDTLDVNSSLTASEASGLLLFRPIRLLAGEGSFGADFREAIFPGLEYMTSGERSLSTLDASPPHDLRCAPHPHRITMPLMAVSSKQGDVVSLMWQMPPDARKSGPAAAFASPNWLRNQDNHLMSLSLPAIPEWTPENSLIAARGMPLKAGQTLRVRGSIYIGSSGEVLDAVRAWFKRFGPPPLPHLARSYRQELAFCLRSYEQTSRRPGKGWLSGLGWTNQPGRHAAIATHYILGEQVLGKDAPFPRMREIAVDEMQGAGDVNLAVHTGRLEDALLAMRSQAYQIMGSQGADGGWGFEPSKQTEILGTRGEKEIGFAGNRVAVMLNAGRMLQDRRLIEAGLRGLKFMDRFRIPRAAQVWEVPVHTPDVLASAHAIDAYLAGYLATGKKEHLNKAAYWAETGIPFNYFWQADEPGVEAMNGGGIPVLGATFFTWPWFGRIVQWCSLDYAASLLRLAPYDRTYDWRRIAEAITRSGMTQQRLEKQYYGMFPDSIGMIDKMISWGAMIAPVRICENVLVMMGKRPIANVKTVRIAGGTASIIYGGDLTVLKSGGSTLELSLQYTPGYSSCLGLVGVADSATVKADGEIVPRGDLEGVRYTPALALLKVSVLHGHKPVHLSISGLRAAKPPNSLTRWTFDNSTQGWVALHDLQPLKVRHGALIATITGSDPYLGISGLWTATADFLRVKIRMKAPHSGRGQLFFSAATPMGEDSSKWFDVQGGPDFRDYVIEMKSHPGWKGTLTELRLDPPGTPGDAIEIDEVALLP
jgi:hypothetical protein